MLARVSSKPLIIFFLFLVEVCKRIVDYDPEHGQ